MRTGPRSQGIRSCYALILCLLGCQSNRSTAETQVQVASAQQKTACLRAFAGAGGGNPNRIDLAGGHSIYVEYIATRPLAINENPTMDTPSFAYSSQLRIPDDMAFVVRRVRYRGAAAGDSNGRGEFAVVVGDHRVVQLRDAKEPAEGLWEGEARIRSGEEARVYLEIANSSWGDVQIEGELVQD